MSKSLTGTLLALPGNTVTLSAQQFLFHSGEPVRRVFVVLEGEIHLVRHQSDGGLVIVQRAGPLALLAEASLFSARYHCDAIAFQPSRVHAIRKPVLQAALRRGHELAGQLTAHLAGQVQAARLRAEILSLKTVADRLDAWLAWHDSELPPRGRLHALALEIGVSPEALYRELGRRRRSG